MLNLPHSLKERQTDDTRITRNFTKFQYHRLFETGKYQELSEND